MPVFKKQLSLESCYLWGLRSVAALFLTSIKGTTVHMYKTYGLNVVKTFLISLNMINIQSKLSMLPLAVAASIHVALHAKSCSEYLNPKWIESLHW
jgi:hypothetical protein